jgi:uncharacterized small protein (TIGR04563 family)
VPCFALQGFAGASRARARAEIREREKFSCFTTRYGAIIAVGERGSDIRRIIRSQLNPRTSQHYLRRYPRADNQSATRGSDKRKQSLYFPEAMLQEIKDEAARLDRSLSWVVQRAWKMARLDIKKIPSVNEVEEDTASGFEPKL